MAAVLDFESLAHSGYAVNYPSTLIVGDYQFTGNQIMNDYLVWGSGSANFAGSTALIPFGIESHTFERTDGAAFDLLGFDISEFTPNTGSGSLLMTGNLQGGGTVTQTITSDGVFGFESIAMNGFVGLTSLQFTTSSDTADRFQYDNISVEQTASPVPLPGAVSLAFGGLAALGALGLRKRRATS
ncbi:hypothetical protein HKCCE3408_00990 [Rhodobacterales bacterium HKCCE3408]|nr:hypothetical protein [Rhodobacterales bacterium HKCCE3408]